MSQCATHDTPSKTKSRPKAACQSYSLNDAAQPNRLPSLIDFSEWHDQQRDWRFESSNGSPPFLMGVMWSTIRAASSRPCSLHARHSGSRARCHSLTCFHLALLYSLRKESPLRLWSYSLCSCFLCRSHRAALVNIAQPGYPHGCFGAKGLTRLSASRAEEALHHVDEVRPRGSCRRTFHFQAHIPGAAFPRGTRSASPDSPRSAPAPFGFHGFNHLIRLHPAILVREARVIQISGLAGALPAMADRNVRT
jgi:hypothetical protein